MVCFINHSQFKEKENTVEKLNVVSALDLNYNDQDENLIESSIDVPLDNEGQDFILSCMYYGFNR
jgi:hypothetical protein